jgi:hypothetical protein
VPNSLRKHEWFKDNVIGIVGCIVVIGACLSLDTTSEPNRWHPAIMWTCTAFSGIALFGRTLWRSWRFWALWAFFLALHVYAMWWFYDRTPRVIQAIGTFLVIPIGFVEAIVVLGLIARVESFLRKGGKAFRVDVKREY